MKEGFVPVLGKLKVLLGRKSEHPHIYHCLGNRYDYYAWLCTKHFRRSVSFNLHHDPGKYILFLDPFYRCND